MTSPVCQSWATIADLCAPCADIYALDDVVMEQRLQEASELLFQLSGQQFTGSCAETVRPCSSQQWSDWIGLYGPGDRFMNSWNGFGLLRACGCNSGHACSCTFMSSIQLLDFTTSVQEVKIGGVLVDSSLYELRANDLVRTDGKLWPTCTDDMTIKFTHGVAPPSSGVTAAAVLACELYLACDPSGKEKCRLPRNISSIARQGVSVIFQSLVNPRSHFRFGIWEIDVFLEAYNPSGTTARSIILSPDVDESLERVT